MSDLTTYERFKEKLKTMDIHAIITSIISGVGSMTAEEMAGYIYILIFAISSYIGIGHSLSKNKYEKSSLELDLDIKKEDLRAKKIANDLTELEQTQKED